MNSTAKEIKKNAVKENKLAKKLFRKSRSIELQAKSFQRQFKKVGRGGKYVVNTSKSAYAGGKKLAGRISALKNAAAAVYADATYHKNLAKRLQITYHKALQSGLNPVVSLHQINEY